MSASPLLARSRVLSRSISLALKHSPPKKSIQLGISPSVSYSERRISFISRLPLDSSCLISMLPLHSAIASARLRSVLSAESQSWGWIPQGSLQDQTIPENSSVDSMKVGLSKWNAFKAAQWFSNVPCNAFMTELLVGGSVKDARLRHASLLL